MNRLLSIRFSYIVLLICMGTLGFSGGPRRNPDSRTPDEDLAHLEERIQETALWASKEEDPGKRDLLKRMAAKLEEVKAYKAKEVKDGKLHKEDRKKMKAAYHEFRALKEKMKDMKSVPDQNKDAVLQKPSPPASTYETASGFKVRLSMPE